MHDADILAVVGATIAVGTAAVGAMNWLIRRERERSDEKFATKEVVAAREAAVRHEFGEVVVEVRDTLRDVQTKMQMILDGQIRVQTNGGER